MSRTALTGALLALAGAATLGAQRSSTIPASHRTTPTLAHRVSARSPEAAVTPILQITPYVGWMMFGTYARRDGNVNFSNQDRPLYGVQAKLALSPYVGLVGNFAYSRTRWMYENYYGPGQDQYLDRVGVWFLDGGFELRLPHPTGPSSSIAPFIQIGAGAVRYTANAGSIEEGATKVAFNGGLGLDVQASRGFGIRLMAKDYLTSLAWSDVTHVSANDRVSNNVALALGLNIGF